MANQKEMRKIFNKTDGVGKVLGGLSLGYSIYDNMKEGNGVIKSVAKGVFDFALFDIASGFLGIPTMMALQFAPMLADSGVALSKLGREKAKHNMSALSKGNVGGYFNDNEYAATMRQRQLQTMGGNLAQTRQLFGNEARRRATNINY